MVHIKLMNPNGTAVGVFETADALRRKLAALVNKVDGDSVRIRARGVIGEAQFNGKIRESEDLLEALTAAGL